MDVEAIADGLWRWTTRHPDWTPESEGWEADVGCVYYESADAVVLVDPLIPTDAAERERFLRALDRDVERAGRPIAVLLTVFWHERSAGEIVERYPEATLWASERAIDRLSVEVSNPFSPGDALPGGLVAHDAARDEVVYWIPEHRAIVPGDVLLGTADGGIRLCPESWLDEGETLDGLRDALRPLLELPVERVLVAHGRPVLANGRDALARALA